MSHVLVIGDSMSLAHVARAMVFAHRLEDLGHQVTFATGTYHQSLVRREGFAAREVYGVPPAVAIAAIRRGSHVFDMKTVAEYVSSDLRLIDDVRPDLIVGDFRLSLNISAEIAGIAYQNIVSGYMIRYYSAPQSPPQTFPAVRMLGRRLSSAMFPLLKRATLKYYAINFNRYRRRHGLDRVRDIFDVISSPHGNFIADIPEYTPCNELPDHYQFVGPLIWEPDIARPDWLSSLEPNRPSVYVTMGSTGNSEAFLKTLTVLRDAGYQVMTTTGGHLREAPEGVFACDFAPGSALLRHSDAVICHGGNLTIYQAVRERVPVVAIPTFHDQEINVDRIEALQWGVGLHPTRWKPSDLLAAVRLVSGLEYQTAVSAGSDTVRRWEERFQQSDPLLNECSSIG